MDTVAPRAHFAPSRPRGRMLFGQGEGGAGTLRVAAP